MTEIKERMVSGGERPQQAREIAPLDADEAQLVNTARRCLMAAIDHSRASHIRLRQAGTQHDDAPTLELPPKALKVISRVLELMGERRPITIVPREHELTTQEAANLLNVSRPFIIKQIQENKLKCVMAGTHRRIAYEEVVRFRNELQQRRSSALDRLAKQAQDLKMGYEEE